MKYDDKFIILFRMSQMLHANFEYNISNNSSSLLFADKIVDISKEGNHVDSSIYRLCFALSYRG